MLVGLVRHLRRHLRRPRPDRPALPGAADAGARRASPPSRAASAPAAGSSAAATGRTGGAGPSWSWSPPGSSPASSAGGSPGNQLLDRLSPLDALPRGQRGRAARRRGRAWPARSARRRPRCRTPPPPGSGRRWPHDRAARHPVRLRRRRPVLRRRRPDHRGGRARRWSPGRPGSASPRCSAWSPGWCRASAAARSTATCCSTARASCAARRASAPTSSGTSARTRPPGSSPTPSRRSSPTAWSSSGCRARHHAPPGRGDPRPARASPTCAHRDLRTLSGGQQQRVAIGSVLTMHPRLLVLDEPTSALDPTAAEEVLATLTRLVHDLGVSVLLAEHRLERVVPFADRMCLLTGDGRVRSGSPPTCSRTRRSCRRSSSSAGPPAGTRCRSRVRDARRRARGLATWPGRRPTRPRRRRPPPCSPARGVTRRARPHRGAARRRPRPAQPAGSPP